MSPPPRHLSARLATPPSSLHLGAGRWLKDMVAPPGHEWVVGMLGTDSMGCWHAGRLRAVTVPRFQHPCSERASPGISQGHCLHHASPVPSPPHPHHIHLCAKLPLLSL